MTKALFFTDLPDALAQHITDCASPDIHVGTHCADLRDSEKIALLSDAEFLILFPSQLSDEVLDASAHLRLIQLVSAGYEKMNIDRCSALGIPVANNGGTNAIDVAEHTLALTLGLYRRLVDLDANVRKGQWKALTLGTQTQTVHGKTLGIVGLGHIGQRVGRLFSALGAQLVYSDPTPIGTQAENALGIERLPLDQLLKAADIVSLHVPLTEGTQHMIGATELAQMKASAVLINTCRGSVVDEKALCEALANRQIAGAGLDVFEAEPCPTDSPLLALPNVLLTPHAAGVTRDTWARRGTFVFDNIRRVLRGCPPLAQIQPDRTDTPRA